MDGVQASMQISLKVALSGTSIIRRIPFRPLVASESLVALQQLIRSRFDLHVPFVLSYVDPDWHSKKIKTEKDLDRFLALILDQTNPLKPFLRIQVSHLFVPPTWS